MVASGHSRLVSLSLLLLLSARLLADDAVDQPQVLVDSLLDADQEKFASLFLRVKALGEQSVATLVAEVERTLALDAQNDAKEKLAKRQTNAAVALLKMDRPEKVWPLLKHRQLSHGRAIPAI